VSYVDSQLLSGETVVYRAHLHKLIFAWPAAFAAIAVVLLGMGLSMGNAILWQVSIGLFVVAAVTTCWIWLRYATSEFAVTNKRVIMKVGWIRRRSIETLLSKVESIGVDQGIMGRMLDFGTISVHGTGGTSEAFPRIGAPLEFRRQVQEVLSRLEESRAGVGVQSGGYAAGSRDERDCPFCAERILVKAKVCKHCGRDVSAVGV
jgi:uncharacterized membrane protein YdbT with pleckstrin-like domain